MDFVEAEGCKDIESFDSPEWVRLAAMQALEAAGITVPNQREEHGSQVLKQGGSGGCFGVALEATQERLPYRVESREGVTVQLPRFFVEAVQFLEQNTDCEGIFRKAGSVARQKNLRLALNAGVSLNDCNVHDVASLLKQYLRELPRPLIPSTLTPALDSCLTLGEREGQRCLLLVCLLLPSTHLQCLRVLVTLLSHVACRGTRSLMSADSLAVVMAPNLLRPQREVLSAMDTSIRAHTVVAKMLIESSSMIGQVPADIIESAQILANEMADCPKDSSCDGGLGEGGSGEETTGRYQKWRKRTASLSGLVMGLGNRLKSKSGRAPHTPSSSPHPGGTDDSAASGHVTKVGRRPSFKRKGSHEDLLANKRPALVPPPSLSRRLLHSPLISHRKRKALLGRRRHTDKVKSPHTSRLPLSQSIFKPSGNFKFDFAKQATNRSPEKGCGLEGVTTPGRVQLVGFTAVHKARKLLVESSPGIVVTEEGSGLDTMTTEQEVGVPDTIATDHRKVDSVEKLNGNTTVSLVSTGEIPRDSTAASRSKSHSESATVISEKEHVYRSQLLAPGVTPIACVRKSQIGCTRTPQLPTRTPLPPTSTGRKSSAKRMRCDTEEDQETAALAGSSATRSRWDIWMSSSSVNQFPSTSFTFKPPGGIRGSQSDHQLGAHTAKKLPAGFGGTKDSPFLMRPRIPTSLSHPSFPLSLPNDRRQDNIQIQGSEVKNLTQTPQDSGNVRFHQSSSTFKYTFSNPRPVKSTVADARTEMPGGSDDANHCVQNFESSRKISDSNEATWLDGVGRQSLSFNGSSPASSGGGIQPSSQISSAAPPPTSLDEAFVQTPCLPLRTANRHLPLHTSNTDPPLHSPNLLEKISHEIAKRHEYSPSTPCLLPDASVQVNDSYKQAVLGNRFALPLANPVSLQFDTSLTETSWTEDGADTSVSRKSVMEKSGTEADITSDTKDALESEETSSARVNKLEQSCTHTTIEADMSLQEEESTEVTAKSQGVSNSYSHNLPLCHFSTKRTGVESKPPKNIKLGKAAWNFATPKAHHKKEKPEGGRWFGMPSPSPRGFSFSLPSPFSRGNTVKEASNCGSYKLSKRAQLYVVSSPTAESLTTCSPPSSTPHSLPTPPPHKPSSQRLRDKENWCVGVSTKVCPSHTIQVREWVV